MPSALKFRQVRPRILSTKKQLILSLKVIFMSLITLLNSRQTLRDKAHEQSLSIQLPMIARRGGHPTPSLGDTKVNETTVRVRSLPAGRLLTLCSSSFSATISIGL